MLNLQPKQTQIYQNKSLQSKQSLIQYYVYQDLQNFINLIFSIKAVKEHFKDNLDHPMVEICNNKIILQLNLSNGIHIDQHQQYKKDKDDEKYYNKEKINAQKILEEVIKQFQQSINEKQKKLLSEQFHQIELYKKYCLGEIFELKQFQLKNTNLPTQFNHKVVSQILNSVKQVDGEVNGIVENKQYNQPNQIEIQQKAEQQYQLTRNQLNSYFPLQNKKKLQNNVEQMNDTKDGSKHDDNHSNQKQLKGQEQLNSQTKVTKYPQHEFFDFSNVVINQTQEVCQLLKEFFGFFFKKQNPQFKKKEKEKDLILNTIENNFIELMKQIKKIQNKNNANEKPSTEFAYSVYQTGILKDLFTMHQIFQVFIQFLNNPFPKNQGYQNIDKFKYFLNSKYNLDYNQDNFLNYLQYQKELIEKQSKDMLQFFVGFKQFYKIK
ncbi:unnamed protein product [Paramecium sonneborni]|uniref:Uncharacterized protein n=1 Tax=Paramecium sonneborni TaxID=65129 RepID=A0A8S1RG33_9CILI|nr:unnamed protein product [Paramecium sonneborni]